MKIAAIVKELVEKESGKSEVKIGDIREIIGIISDLFHEQPAELMAALIANGKRRAGKKRQRVKARTASKA